MKKASLGIKLQEAKDAHLSHLMEFVQNPDFTFEQKLDGRRMAWETGSGHLYNKKGQYIGNTADRVQYLPKPFSSTYPILDGEYVEYEGHHEFWCFDIVNYNFQNSKATFFDRRNFIENFCIMNKIPLVKSCVTAEEKANFAAQALNWGAEGLIAKDKTKIYGAVGSMFKLKFKKRVDCVVMDVNDKESVDVGLWDSVEQEYVPIGSVSTYGKERPYIRDVLEVEYLYVSRNGRLVQPVLIRIRDDKIDIECTFDQLLTTTPKAVI